MTTITIQNLTNDIGKYNYQVVEGGGIEPYAHSAKLYKLPNHLEVKIHDHLGDLAVFDKRLNEYVDLTAHKHGKPQTVDRLGSRGHVFMEVRRSIGAQQ